MVQCFVHSPLLGQQSRLVRVDFFYFGLDALFGLPTAIGLFLSFLSQSSGQKASSRLKMPDFDFILS